MELKTYLLILLKKWWIVAPIFLVTLTTAIVIAYTTPPTYRATATYIVSPSAGFGDVRSFATGLNILSNREEILATYTQVASSQKIKNTAADSINLERPGQYSVDSNVLKGTNVMRITATGPDPTTVRSLANAIGAVSIDYMESLYEVYTLSPLDEARAPRNPVSPNRIRDIGLAAVLGLVLGASIAFLVAYLESPLETIVGVNIVDRKTGAYNKQYFLQRLGQEMVRAKRNRYPLSLALLRINGFDLLTGFNSAKVSSEALRHVALIMKQYLREEDLLGYLGNNVFGVLNDTSGEQAQAIMEYLQTRIEWATFESQITDVKLNLTGKVGVVAYKHNGAGRDQLIDMAADALELAEVSENGRSYLKEDESESENVNGSNQKD
jgi:diguanylate cyclase (GGDEF)-like protein